MYKSKFPSELDQPTLSEVDGVRYLHFHTEWVQGAMRIKNPAELVLEYTSQMMAWLLFLEPVSYTHLDVYKRQIAGNARDVLFPRRTVSGFRPCRCRPPARGAGPATVPDAVLAHGPARGERAEMESKHVP